MAPLDRDADLSLARLSCSLVPASANKNKLKRQIGHISNLPHGPSLQDPHMQGDSQ